MPSEVTIPSHYFLVVQNIGILRLALADRSYPRPRYDPESDMIQSKMLATYRKKLTAPASYIRITLCYQHQITSKIFWITCLHRCILQKYFGTHIFISHVFAYYRLLMNNRISSLIWRRNYFSNLLLCLTSDICQLIQYFHLLHTSTACQTIINTSLIIQNYCAIKLDNYHWPFYNR